MAPHKACSRAWNKNHVECILTLQKLFFVVGKYIIEKSISLFGYSYIIIYLG